MKPFYNVYVYPNEDKLLIFNNLDQPVYEDLEDNEDGDDDDQGIHKLS